MPSTLQQNAPIGSLWTAVHKIGYGTLWHEFYIVESITKSGTPRLRRIESDVVSTGPDTPTDHQKIVKPNLEKTGILCIPRWSRNNDCFVISKRVVYEADPELEYREYSYCD